MTRRRWLLLPLGSFALLGCGGDEGVAGSPDTSIAPDAPVGSTPDPDGRPFVLPDTDSLALLDVQLAAPVEFGVWPTFARDGSPDDDRDGPRVGFAAIDATASPIDDVIAEGVEIAVGDRTFVWSTDAENSRTYAGPTPLGHTIALATLNVEESTAVDLLVEAELVNGRVVFAGQLTPDGWIDTGASTAVMSFLAGATGSSAPIGGTRSLYSQPTAMDEPTWDNIADDLGVTLSAWPVTSDDPDNEARYSLDGELEVDVLRADGTTALGFSTPADSEFFEFVVWREGETWLALSRPTRGDPAGLIDLAASVRVATPPEAHRFATLAAE